MGEKTNMLETTALQYCHTTQLLRTTPASLLINLPKSTKDSNKVYSSTDLSHKTTHPSQLKPSQTSFIKESTSFVYKCNCPT